MDFQQLLPGEQIPDGFPAGDFIRRLRRVADLSQRQLAKVGPVSRATVERIESGQLDPRVGQLQGLFDLVGWWITVTDVDGRLVLPLGEPNGDLRDGADRRFPPHLDLILDPDFGEWWADRYGLARPPETFKRDRAVRDAMRARSQYSLYRGPYRRS